MAPINDEKCVIFVFIVLCIFRPVSRYPNLLLILNKQIGTYCLIYNPLVYLSCVESVQVKKNNHMLLPRFKG